MNRTKGRDNDCDRVESAIVEGRFLEDPSLWRPHVESCDACRGTVTGLFALREHVRQAGLEAPVVELSPASDGARTIETAFRRFHRGRRIRTTSICVVVALLAVAGGVMGLPREEAKPEDPIAYARHLQDTVFGSGTTPDYELLQRDEGLRAEFLRALDSPSSSVRGSAMSALLLSGIPIEPGRLERVLSQWRESLESPVEVASNSNPDTSRFVSDALFRRRTETLLRTLQGLQVPSAPGAVRLSSASISPFLSYPDEEVRESALLALRADPRYVPGEDAERLLRFDPDPDVRKASAQLLIDRLGATGVSAVIARLRSRPDDSLEEGVASRLSQHPDGLKFLRERVASEMTPLPLSLVHALALYRVTKELPPAALMERALVSPTRASFRAFVSLASAADLATYRGRLQEAWKGMGKAARSDGGVMLVLWDADSRRDEARLSLALDICEADRDDRAREPVQSIAKADSATIRDRAERLLASWPKK